MRDVMAELERWQREGKRAALATVVGTWGSSPRPIGAHMAISEAGEICGSVSGGCVEGAVVQEALTVLAEGKPRLLAYGVADALAQSVGLACGGTIEVWVEPLPLASRAQSGGLPAGE